MDRLFILDSLSNQIRFSGEVSDSDGRLDTGAKLVRSISLPNLEAADVW